MQIFIRKYRSSLNLVQVQFLTELCPLKKEIKKISVSTLLLWRNVYTCKVDIVYTNILQENGSQFQIWSRSKLSCTCLAIFKMGRKCKVYRRAKNIWGENNHVYIILEKVPCLLHVLQYINSVSLFTCLHVL